MCVHLCVVCLCAYALCIYFSHTGRGERVHVKVDTLTTHEHSTIGQIKCNRMSMRLAPPIVWLPRTHFVKCARRWIKLPPFLCFISVVFVGSFSNSFVHHIQRFVMPDRLAFHEAARRTLLFDRESYISAPIIIIAYWQRTFPEDFQVKFQFFLKQNRLIHTGFAFLWNMRRFRRPQKRRKRPRKKNS